MWWVTTGQPCFEHFLRKSSVLVAKPWKGFALHGWKPMHSGVDIDGHCNKYGASNWRNYDLRIFKRWNWSKSWPKQSQMAFRSTTWVRGFAQLPMLHDFWHPDLHPDRGIWRAAEKSVLRWDVMKEASGNQHFCTKSSQVWKAITHLYTFVDVCGLWRRQHNCMS